MPLPIPDLRDFIAGPKSLITNAKGEFGAFTQLFFDNLSTMVGLLVAIVGNFNGVFGVDRQVIGDIIFKKATPGLGLALVWGNIFYSYQGARETRNSGRQFTAQPYGINTVGAFAFVFSVMIPVYLAEWTKAGNPDDIEVKNQAFRVAYETVIAGNFIVGILNVVLAFVGPIIMRVVPPASLLVPIAGIGFTFLGIAQMSTNFGNPVVGFLPLIFVFIGWYSHVKLFGFIPEALTIIVVGTVLAWIDPATRGVAGEWGLALKAERAAETISTFVPDPESFAEIGRGMDQMGNYMGIVIPVAITATAFTLMCLLSARNAGDPYPIRETMLMDGIGTMIAACFGSPFGTVVYIGHPVHKRTGATVGYSWLNGWVYFIIGFSGLFTIFEAIFPVHAVGPIILLVGLMICEDAVKNLPQRHWAIFFFGLFFSTCDWATTALGNTALQTTTQWGIFAMKRGAPLISFFWCAFLTYIVDRVWWKASAWALLSAVFAIFGIIHQAESGVAKIEQGVLGPFLGAMGDQPCIYDIVEGEPAMFPNNPLECASQPWRFAIGYVMIAAVCSIGEVLQRMGFGPPPVDSSKDVMNFQIDWNDVSHIHGVDHPHVPMRPDKEIEGGSSLEYITQHGMPKGEIPINIDPDLTHHSKMSGGGQGMQYPQMYPPQPPAGMQMGAPYTSGQMMPPAGYYHPQGIPMSPSPALPRY